MPSRRCVARARGLRRDGSSGAVVGRHRLRALLVSNVSRRSPFALHRTLISSRAPQATDKGGRNRPHAFSVIARGGKEYIFAAETRDDRDKVRGEEGGGGRGGACWGCDEA